MTSDENALINAAEVSSYLQNRGWRLDGDWRGARVWRLGSRARLLVPDHHEYDDADDLIQEAIAKIAKYEARPERDVRLDIAEAMVDTQYFRIHPDTPAGSIPLPTGLKVVQSINSLVKTAAIAVEEGPELLYEGRRSARVDAFLHTVLLRSATPGSYVLTARIPATPRRPLTPAANGTEFSGRSISSQLFSALLAARAATQQVIAGEQFSLEPFYGAVNAGVSANLCKALADLGGEDKDQRFEIGFGWARGLSTKNVPGEVVFSEATPQILAQAGDELTAMARAGTAHITGRVKDLQEQPGGRHRVQVRGVLRMEHGANLRRRSVWVVVNGEQHEVAIEAYRARQNVEIAGRLSTDRGSLELLAATLHRVL